MAEETVVKEILNNEMIEAGKGLTRRLDQARLGITASLWFYITESNVWRFIIASPEVRSHGPKKVYQKIQSVLSEIQSSIPLKDISVVENDHPLISLLRVAVRSDVVSGIRFSKNTINGHFIEDSYVYKMT